MVELRCVPSLAMGHELGKSGVGRSDPGLLLAGNEQGRTRGAEGCVVTETLREHTPERQTGCNPQVLRVVAATEEGQDRTGMDEGCQGDHERAHQLAAEAWRIEGG